MKKNAIAWAALVISLAAFFGSRLPARLLPAGQEIPEAGQKAANDLSAAFNAVAEHVRPSVVQINVAKRTDPVRMGAGQRGQGPDMRQVDPKDMEDMFKRFFGERGFGQAFPGEDEQGLPRRGLPNGFRIEPQQSAMGTGSGFVYDDKGHILTNNHVVDGADEISVTFHDGTVSKARILGQFVEADVAVIQVEESSPLHAVRLGDSQKLKVGDWVMAVGSPFGLSQTVTAGIVSATERDNLGINRFESFIQTDAAINRGNSGGPLVDMNGRVVGINSAIATGNGSNAGVGFAIPIDMAKRIADKLIQKGKLEKALMGVNLDTLRPALARQLGLEAKTHGVLIMNVGRDTPAEKAGLKVGDVITQFDGVPVRSSEGLTYLVQTSDAGNAYRVTYLRDGKPFDVMVTPEPRERFEKLLENARAKPESRQAPMPEPAAVSGYGLAVTPLTPELAKRFGYQGQFSFESGLIVTDVKPDSPAAESGIEKGDLITRYVQEKVIREAVSADDFNKMLDSQSEIAVWVEDVNHRLPGEFKTLNKPESGK
jgi:serine protease Do